MTVVEPRPLVVLAEDHQDTRDLYAWHLSTLGFLVTEARDGHEALQRARECEPDVMVMDLSLPVLDACQVIRRLQTEAPTRRIPIIGLNGYGFFQHSLAALSAGC